MCSMNPLPTSSVVSIVRKTKPHIQVVFLCRECVRVRVDGPREICRRCHWIIQNRSRIAADTHNARLVLALAVFLVVVVVGGGWALLRSLGVV